MRALLVGMIKPIRYRIEIEDNGQWYAIARDLRLDEAQTLAAAYGRCIGHARIVAKLSGKTVVVSQ